MKVKKVDVSEVLKNLVGDREPLKVIDEGICEKCKSQYQIWAGKSWGGNFEYFEMKKCQCGNIQLAREAVLRKEELVKEARILAFEKLSHVPKSLQSVSFKNFNPFTTSQHEALVAMLDYCKTFDLDNGINAILAGSNGVGKSHLAYATAKRLSEKGFTSCFISVPKLLSRLRDTYGTADQLTEVKFLDQLEKVDFLVLDDIGSCKATDWATEKMFLICDSRQGKHTVFTTSKSSADIKALYGNDTFSRMNCDFENWAFKLEGEDGRTKHL